MKKDRTEIIAMLIILLSVVLLKCDLTAQVDTSIICSTDVGVKYSDVTLQSGYVGAAFVILDHVTADTLDVYVRDSAVMLNDCNFIKLNIHSIQCPIIVSAMAGNADAIAYNSIVVDILMGMVLDISDLSNDVCESGKANLEASMNIIRFKGEFVQDLRADIEANLTGRNLDIWNAFKTLGDYNAQEIIHICDDYLGLLSEPCVGTGGTSLDIRLGGRLDRLEQSVRRLIEKHEAMKNIFTL